MLIPLAFVSAAAFRWRIGYCTLTVIVWR